LVFQVYVGSLLHVDLFCLGYVYPWFTLPVCCYVTPYVTFGYWFAVPFGLRFLWFTPRFGLPHLPVWFAVGFPVAWTVGSHPTPLPRYHPFSYLLVWFRFGSPFGYLLVPLLHVLVWFTLPLGSTLYTLDLLRLRLHLRAVPFNTLRLWLRVVVVYGCTLRLPLVTFHFATFTRSFAYASYTRSVCLFPIPLVDFTLILRLFIRYVYRSRYGLTTFGWFGCDYVYVCCYTLLPHPGSDLFVPPQFPFAVARFGFGLLPFTVHLTRPVAVTFYVGYRLRALVCTLVHARSTLIYVCLVTFAVPFTFGLVCVGFVWFVLFARWLDTVGYVAPLLRFPGHVYVCRLLTLTVTVYPRFPVGYV